MVLPQGNNVVVAGVNSNRRDWYRARTGTGARRPRGSPASSPPDASGRTTSSAACSGSRTNSRSSSRSGAPGPIFPGAIATSRTTDADRDSFPRGPAPPWHVWFRVSASRPVAAHQVRLVTPGAEKSPGISEIPTGDRASETRRDRLARPQVARAQGFHRTPFSRCVRHAGCESCRRRRADPAKVRRTGLPRDHTDRSTPWLPQASWTSLNRNG